jgi:predicted pyridoxine 5'-phosphate oxidase superfamily flavin-nucleotide-binding protein
MRETKTGRVALGDDGVITVWIQSTAKQTLDNAKENLAAALASRDGKRRPLLIDVRGGQPLDAEVRHYYSGQVLVDGFTALGLLVDATPLGLMMGNVYFRVARPGIPTRLFTNADEATRWLRDHIS